MRLVLLDFLLRTETSSDICPSRPSAVAGLPTVRPPLDQQPIEVAALADACARAYGMTGDPPGSTP